MKVVQHQFLFVTVGELDLTRCQTGEIFTLMVSGIRYDYRVMNPRDSEVARLYDGGTARRQYLLSPIKLNADLIIQTIQGGAKIREGKVTKILYHQQNGQGL